MLGLRHQLAAYSPLPLAAQLAAVRPRRRAGDAALRELELRLAQEFHAESALLCASGTQALQLAIEHAVAQTGGPAVVALPGFCCYDVAAAAVGASVRVGLYDLDPDTLSPELTSLERLLKGGVRVVVVAHLYGVPVRWREVEELAAAYGALVIEDAAQGHGGRWAGRPLGSLGALSVLSFGRGKGWTGGRGGALLLREGRGRGIGPGRLAPAASAADAKNLLASFAQWALGRPSLYGLPMAVPGLRLGETTYHPPTPPRPMPASAARLLLGTAAAARAEAQRRREVAARLADAIAGTPSAGAIRSALDAEPGFLRLPLRLPAGLRAFVDPRAARRLGIAPTYPTPLAALPVLRERLIAAATACPGAEILVRELVTLPAHSLLSPADLDRIRRIVLSASVG